MDEDYELARASGATKTSGQSHYSQRRATDRDEADLARLGKKPVLKVSPAPDPRTSMKTNTWIAAQIWVHVATGLQLYDSHHLGGHAHVILNESTLLQPS